MNYLIVDFLFRGSAIAKVAGENVGEKPNKFTAPVTMYVYEEIIDGRKLSEIINTDHENPKYMPGVKLPDNVVCTPCLKLFYENI